MRLKAVPTVISVTGLYDVDYRIVAACRDGRVYTMRGGEVMATVLELEAPPTGLVVANQLIHVAQMDNAVHAFSYRGKKMFSLYRRRRWSMGPLVSKSLQCRRCCCRWPTMKVCLVFVFSVCLSVYVCSPRRTLAQCASSASSMFARC